MADLASTRQIVFFDGVCNLCNSAVDWIIARDGRQRFHFASLQGDSAEKLLPAEDRTSLGSIVLLKNGAFYRRSAAITQILSDLGGAWPYVALVLKIVPPFLRDAGYSLVARYRYAVFGRRQTCRLPTPEEKQRFLE